MWFSGFVVLSPAFAVWMLLALIRNSVSLLKLMVTAVRGNYFTHPMCLSTRTHTCTKKMRGTRLHMVVAELPHSSHSLPHKTHPERLKRLDWTLVGGLPTTTTTKSDGCSKACRKVCGDAHCMKVTKGSRDLLTPLSYCYGVYCISVKFSSS